MNILYYLQFYFTTIASFFLFGGYTICIDLSNKSLDNRIQHDNRRTLFNIYLKIIPLVLFNLFVTTPIFNFIIFQLLHYNNNPYYPKILSHSLLKLLFYKYFVDIPFYIGHRIFHSKYLYKYHKKHHEIKAPVGISALYSHPIDYVFGNLVPVFVPLILFNADFVSLHIWTFFTIFATIYESHGGFKNLSEFHDFHHKYFKYNFGTNVFMDKILNTYKLKF